MRTVTVHALRQWIVLPLTMLLQDAVAGADDYPVHIKLDFADVVDMNRKLRSPKPKSHTQDFGEWVSEQKRLGVPAASPVNLHKRRKPTGFWSLPRDRRTFGKGAAPLPQLNLSDARVRRVHGRAAGHAAPPVPARHPLRDLRRGVAGARRRLPLLRRSDPRGRGRPLRRELPAQLK